MRFEPPSPNAKVRPATTMATRERPRAIVLVKACWRTFTAFSHGDPPPCEKAGTAKKSAAATKTSCRNAALHRVRFRQIVRMCGTLLSEFVLKERKEEFPPIPERSVPHMRT